MSGGTIASLLRFLLIIGAIYSIAAPASKYSAAQKQAVS